MPCSGFSTLRDFPIQLLLARREKKEKMQGQPCRLRGTVPGRVQNTPATSAKADVGLVLAGATRRKVLSLNTLKDAG